jgi:hypothetical protein
MLNFWTVTSDERNAFGRLLHDSDFTCIAWAYFKVSSRYRLFFLGYIRAALGSVRDFNFFYLERRRLGRSSGALPGNR